jgi:hypothetical protein
MQSALNLSSEHIQVLKNDTVKNYKYPVCNNVVVGSSLSLSLACIFKPFGYVRKKFILWPIFVSRGMQRVMPWNKIFTT